MWRAFMSEPKRDVLLAHLDGIGVPIEKFSRSEVAGLEASKRVSRYKTTTALIMLGWLRTDNKIKPTTTYITDLGREVLGKALGDWADASARLQEIGDSRRTVITQSEISALISQ